MVVWLLIVFVVVVGVGAGAGLVTSGLEGRAAVTGGPVGVFTPTERQCGKNGCSWVGEYVSEDGAIVRTGVPLRDAVRIRPVDPMPSRIDGVRLADDEDRPEAYTVDFDWVWSSVAGLVLLASCLVAAFLMARTLRRHRAGARAS